MNKNVIFFSIALLASPLVKASEPEPIEVTIIEAPVAQYAQIVDALEPQQAEVITVPEPETAVFIEASTRSVIPAKVFHYESGNFNWSEWAQEWDAVLFNIENIDALNSAQEFGLTVGTVKNSGALCIVVILETDNKDLLQNWLANQ